MTFKRNKNRKVNAKGRNEFEKFVKLDHYMLSSDAYRLLSPQARVLLVEFIFKFDGRNNGLLFMSQRDAAKVLGVATHQTAGKYVDELVCRGFLEVVLPGSFDNKQRHASVYRLTMKTNENQMGPPTKEFMSIQLSDEEKSRVARMQPSWLQHKPRGRTYIPVGYVDAVDNQLREQENRRDRGADSSTTYNIPRECSNSGDRVGQTAFV